MNKPQILLSITERKSYLKQLLLELELSEDAICDALYRDFKKPAFETVLTETHYVKSVIKELLGNLDSWTKPKWVRPSLLNFPSTEYILKDPYGSVLVIAPWNYPFQLALCPVIAAFSAGNRVTLKPSELTPTTSSIIADLIGRVFPKEWVEVIEGDATVASQLLAQRWDYIFFTGSVSVGKLVAQAAAQHLTPTTLELGGKNPCIVHSSATIQLSAKRIVWGKFINAGQTCIAPDYVLVDAKIKDQLVQAIQVEIEKAYGVNTALSPDFTRIVNKTHYNRLIKLLENQTILFGGIADANDHFISTTLVNEPSLESAMMQDEIFGPILPIISYQVEAEIEAIIARYEKPLALYVFANDITFSKKISTQFSFGGGCINDTVIQFNNKRLPFGGVGHSGYGAYHGKYSIDTFLHHKSMVRKANWLDLPMRYAPYKNKLAGIRKMLRWL
ncbi:MAG: aldehyde dehydrogenase family protein [Flavobacterium sp.]|jgi:aldehyde dehydrogenase (NAD+)